MMTKEKMHLVAKLVTEFIGTLFLCLTVSLSGTAGGFAPLVIGSVLMTVIYAGGHVSGAHYNPAVTVALLVRGSKVPPVDAVLYVFTQIGAGFIAALLSWALLPEGKEGAAYPKVHEFVGAGNAFVAEMMITFTLCCAVLFTATSKACSNNSFYGLAIGFSVVSGAFAVGGKTGGAFNPAVGTMPLLYGSDGEAENVWIYWVAPLTGAILSGLAFRICATSDFLDEPFPFMEGLAACLMEYFGTMLLCYVVGVATGLFRGFAIGSMLMVWVYIGGAVSGGHYNPAVTLGVLLRTLFGATHDTFSVKKAVMYLFSQIFGAACGTMLALATTDSRHEVLYPTPLKDELGSAFLGEILGTFVLVYVILNVATAKQLAGNSFFGLAIGQTVTAMAYTIGPISGGAFNPAVGLMGAFLGGPSADLDDIWIYWIACPLGGAIAALVFRLQNFEEFKGDLTDLKFLCHVSDGTQPKYMVHAHNSHGKNNS